MGRSLRGLTSETLADQAYEAIRSAIASGELRRGEKVTERGLAERLGVSPTPVREALRRLEQDRLIERTGPRSVRVAEFAESTVLELSLLESTLRALAARLAAENATKSDLRAMARVLDAADAEFDRYLALAGASDAELAEGAQRVFVLAREFHEHVDRACHNDVVLHMLGMAEAFTVEQRAKTLHDQILLHRREPQDRYAQHREVFDAITTGDGARAEAVMFEHAHGAGRELAAARR